MDAYLGQEYPAKSDFLFVDHESASYFECICKLEDGNWMA